MRPRSIATAFAALALLTASSASAQSEGLDEVALKNGGVLRGTVVGSEPGASVRIIEMGQKEVRVIPWSEVANVERGKHAPKGAPAPPPPAQPAAPQMGTPGVVRLHVDSPVPVQIIEQQGTTVGAYGGYGMVLEQVRPLCMSPCDRVVDGTAGQFFSITPADMPPPRAWTFAGMTGDVNLTIEPGSWGKRMGGIWLAIIGGSAAVSGLILLPVALTTHSSGGSSSTNAMKYAGGGMLGGGVAMFIGGIALIATSTTRVRIDQRSPRAAIAPRYWLGEF